MRALNPPIKDWRGKRVWIVGASSGIGWHCAAQLVQAGAQVALSARRAAPLDELAEQAKRGQAMALPLDITDSAALHAACARIVADWDGLDLVLICAGSYAEMRAESFDLNSAEELLDLNLRGVLRCLDAVLPQLLAQRSGAIALVSSVAGLRGLPRALAYGPTKAALINLAETLYLDLRAHGVGVHLVNPGFVDTRLTRDNRFPMPALMQAEQAAAALLAGVARGDFHIHFPKRFTAWLQLARLLPYRCYFALVRRVTGL